MKNVRSTLTRSFSYLDSHFQRYNSFITFNARSIGVKVERSIVMKHDRSMRSSMNDNNYCFREYYYYYYYVIMLIIPISNIP